MRELLEFNVDYATRGISVFNSVQYIKILLVLMLFLLGTLCMLFILTNLYFCNEEQQNTPWTDQLGRHCPHFGVDTEVSLI